jgi:hypothetical protein
MLMEVIGTACRVIPLRGGDRRYAAGEDKEESIWLFLTFITRHVSERAALARVSRRVPITRSEGAITSISF